MLMHGERSARLKPKFQTWRNNRAEPVSQDVSTMRPGPVLGQSDASSVHNVKVHFDDQPQPVDENLSSHPPLLRIKSGGASRDRTDDPLLAKQVLSQLSYGPEDMRWWAWVDSNYRPHAYQACALTN